MDLTKVFTDSSIAAAMVFTVLMISNKFFKYLNTKVVSDAQSIKQRNDTENQVVKQLCCKIDNLVESNHRVIEKIGEATLATTKDQQETLTLLMHIAELLVDIQKRTARIDERTRACLGDPVREGEQYNA